MLVIKGMPKSEGKPSKRIIGIVWISLCNKLQPVTNYVHSNAVELKLICTWLLATVAIILLRTQFDPVLQTASPAN